MILIIFLGIFYFGLFKGKTLEDVVKNLKIDSPSDVSHPSTIDNCRCIRILKLPNPHGMGMWLELANLLVSGGTFWVSSKEGNTSDAISCISSSGDAACIVKESDIDQESLMADQGIYYAPTGYYGYYYPAIGVGYDVSFGEWDDHSYFYGSDGMGIQYPAFQADNGSPLYYVSGYQPGYHPCSPYTSGAMVGVDGEYLGQQIYLPNPIFSQPLPSPGFLPSPVPYGSEVVPAYLWDPSMFADGGLVGGVPTATGPKPNSIQSQTMVHSKSTAPSKSSSAETKGSLPVLNASPHPVLHSQSLKPAKKVQQNGFQAPALLTKSYIPMPKFPSYPTHGRGDMLYSNSPLSIKANERGWGTKLKTRIKANGMNDSELLNEQNRGPRTNGTRNSWSVETVQSGSPADEGKDNSSRSTVIRRDQYNLPDFPTKYDYAVFYVIKSYSEDDIHKSIKYNVWSSTPNGNKRLDSAYKDAHERMGENSCKCPVFLFFSVNASGQFCGVAEMIGHVDFDKNMDFWQQDKWNGFFPVKWHIIKDIPNPQFRHVILENNENKPVTNSRDTQEVKFPQGSEMLNIFKSYTAKTSILDDFGFYESRQKAMQEKRMAPLVRIHSTGAKLSWQIGSSMPGSIVSVQCAGRLKKTEVAHLTKASEEKPAIAEQRRCRYNLQVLKQSEQLTYVLKNVGYDLQILQSWRHEEKASSGWAAPRDVKQSFKPGEQLAACSLEIHGKQIAYFGLLLVGALVLGLQTQCVVCGVV
ncbi:YTH domain-containing protein [Asimina triloba]